MGDVVMVSACLAGEKCRYDGSHSKNEELLESLKNSRVITFCPEQAGGLSTPRTPAEIECGNGLDALNKGVKVIDRNGKDVTACFLDGALEGLRVARESGVKTAYLKENSPSCGVNFIKVKGNLVEGPGVFAAILSSNDFSLQGV